MHTPVGDIRLGQVQHLLHDARDFLSALEAQAGARVCRFGKQLIFDEQSGVPDGARQLAVQLVLKRAGSQEHAFQVRLTLALEMRGKQLREDEQQRLLLGAEWLYLRVGDAERAEEGAICADNGSARVGRDGGVGR